MNVEHELRLAELLEQAQKRLRTIPGARDPALAAELAEVWELVRTRTPRERMGKLVDQAVGELWDCAELLEGEDHGSCEPIRALANTLRATWAELAL